MAKRVRDLVTSCCIDSQPTLRRMTPARQALDGRRLPPRGQSPQVRAPVEVSPDSTAPSQLRGAVDMEDLLNGLAEEAGERDRQRKRRRVALLLDGVDGLARHVHGLRQLLLGELVRRSEASDVVAHGGKRALLYVKLACHERDVKPLRAMDAGNRFESPGRRAVPGRST